MIIPTVALPHRVTIVPFKGNGAYGPIYDDLNKRQNVPCRIERKVQRVKDSEGSEILQQAEGIFQPGARLKMKDKIVWDDYGIEYTVENWIPVEAMGPHSIESVLT